MVTELLCHSDTTPCVICEDVPGTLPGSRILVNFWGAKRKNMTFGFPTHLSKLELSEAYRRHYTSGLKLIPPKEVATGPIFENIMTGEDIDVTCFPAPVWHDGDEGNRYIGTASYDVTRDPDEGRINCGTYRVMVHDKTSVALYISPGKHGRMDRDKYLSRNQPMPVAIVCGGDPLTFLTASSEVPFGICEYDIVGGMRGRALEVVRGKVTGLPFPANAEIVIEGFVEPGNLRPEGPFGEWTGYYASASRGEPVVNIKAIYYRNNPIILGTAPNRPPDEENRFLAIVRSALLRDNIEKSGSSGHQLGLEARDRRNTTAGWGLHYPALPGPRHPGRPHRLDVSCRRLLRPLRRRGQRRHRSVEPGRADVGDGDAFGSGDLHRHHPQCLEYAARPADRTGTQGGRRLHQQPSDHQRLPPVSLAG